jgi:hypothetical protein
MKASRNDPCPCGSGRKYKSCCMAADQATARVSRIVGEENLRDATAAWQQVARRTPVWQADVAPTVAGVRESPDGISMAMVTAAGFVVAGDVVTHRPGTDEERARVVAQVLGSAARVLGVYPEVLQVRDEALADALSEELAPRDVRVEAAPLDELDDALDAAMDHLGGRPGSSRLLLALTWRETGASPQDLSDLHAAAASFYESAPWAVMDDRAPVLLGFPDGSAWSASVMGGAEIAYGLSLYSSPLDMAAIAGNELAPGEILRDMDGCSLTVSFDTSEELTRTMRREVAGGGWALVSPEAYPRLYGISLPERRITAEHVRTATLALRAVVCLARGEDPSEAVGVEAMLLPNPEDLAGEEITDSLWKYPDNPRPITAEGPGADPSAALRWNEDADRFREEEQGRLMRFGAWLEAQGVANTPAKADLRVAREWARYLDMTDITAPAATEYDLRSFVYTFIPRFATVPQAVLKALPRAMGRLAAFLEEREGIRYPFAAEVIDELEAFWARAAEHGDILEDVLEELAERATDDLYFRNLVPESLFRDYADEVPDAVIHRTLPLYKELQRQWLLWFDEEVRSGVDDWNDLEERMSDRQLAWEETPTPLAGGRTPAEMIGKLFEEGR